MNHRSTCPLPDPVALATWRAELVEAQRNPWLASLVMRRLEVVRLRFLELCRRLSTMPRRTRRGLVKTCAMSIPAAALLFALTGGPASAATINVGGACDLQEAIENANGGAVNGDCTAGDPGADTIVLPNSTFLLDTNYGAALPDITDDLTIEGNGATLDAEGAFRVLSASRPLTIEETTITGGSVSGIGAGIQVSNNSLLTITDSTIDGNTATGGSGIGGGLYARRATISGSTISGNSASQISGAVFVGTSVSISGSLIDGNTSRIVGGLYTHTATITDSIISGNRSSNGTGGGVRVRETATITGSTIRGNTAASGNNGAGGLYMGYGTVTESTISDNFAAGYGGGVYVRHSATITGSTISGNTANTGGGISARTVTIVNSTVSGNTANGNGGGVLLRTAGGLAYINNATIVDNSAATGGGLHVASGTSATIGNSIVADQAGGTDCAGPGVVADGGLPNLDGDGSCGFSITGGSGLASLADNGGPTETHKLQAGSSAVDAGDNASCETADQRGIARPQEGDGVAPPVCDLGAYERQAQGTIVIEKVTSPPGDSSSFIFTNDIDGADFLLEDGESKIFDEVLAGTYKVSEVDPSPDHVLLSIDCDDDNSATALLTATINLDPSEVVTCTFTNAPKVDVPTAAVLSLFAADTSPTGRVALRWETGSEAGVLGFNLYRATSAGGSGVRINRNLIPSRGNAAHGGRYELTDSPGIGAHYYKIEIINVDDRPQVFGPVVARVDELRAFLPLLQMR